MNTPSAPLSQQAVEEITNMIVNQRRFRPGDKIPNELDLSNELGISRITLREAIRVLCANGLLEVRRGRGTFVISDRVKPAREQNAICADANIRELLELRLALEPMTAHAAARLISDENLKKLQDSFNAMRLLVEQKQDFFREYFHFHQLIAESGGNRPAARFLSEIFYAMPSPLSPGLSSGVQSVSQSVPPGVQSAFQSVSPGVQSAFQSVSPGVQNNPFVSDHNDILYYLSVHDPDGAETSMRLHILHLWRLSGLDWI